MLFRILIIVKNYTEIEDYLVGEHQVVVPKGSVHRGLAFHYGCITAPNLEIIVLPVNELSLRKMFNTTDFDMIINNSNCPTSDLSSAIKTMPMSSSSMMCKVCTKDVEPLDSVLIARRNKKFVFHSSCFSEIAGGEYE